MTETDPDTLARQSLHRHRTYATGLLVLMAALTLYSYKIPQDWWSGLLQSAAKAGFVGGIADWFAITALFRHPLGIPIPHTAIIPNQRERLGRALGRFVANHVFTSDEVSHVLSNLDLPGIVHRFLADPAAAHPAAVGLAGMLPKLLTSVEDGRARRLMTRMTPRILGGAGAGKVVASALHNLVDGGRHQEMFGFLLAQMKTALAGRESALRYAIEDRVREQAGGFVGWMVGASIARRVLWLVSAELDKMSPDGSDLRIAFDEWIRREINRMETDPARAAEVGAAIRRLVSNETVQAWLWDVWGRLRHALEDDLKRPNGRTVAYMKAALANMGTILEEDPVARARLQKAVQEVVASLLPAAQLRIAEFITSVVAHWDADTITDRLELRIGKDLQFIRMNGTIVGFIIGGLLFVVLERMFGHPGF
jgi:uncharacterized membrane-anchored protein YjiN (DUF445 family)